MKRFATNTLIKNSCFWNMKINIDIKISIFFNVQTYVNLQSNRIIGKKWKFQCQHFNILGYSYSSHFCFLLTNKVSIIYAREA